MINDERKDTLAAQKAIGRKIISSIRSSVMMKKGKYGNALWYRELETVLQEMERKYLKVNR